MIMAPVMEVDDGCQQILHGPSGLGEWLDIYLEFCRFSIPSMEPEAVAYQLPVEF